MYYKYPRTPHLPWSPGRTDDDRVLQDVEHFLNREVVVTEKLDGENTSLYRDHCHARSLDSGPHPSRSWVRNLHGALQHEIPEGWRICGENLYAQHSLPYVNLPSYFLVFAIYDEMNRCLSWDQTREWVRLLGLELVPELYRGIWDDETIRSLWTGESVFGGEGEGYVVRLASAFPYDEHWRSVAKYVRANHVQTDDSWLVKPVVKNLLHDKPQPEE